MYLSRHAKLPAELLEERGREPWQHDGAGEPALEPLDLPLDGVLPVPADVLERPPDDLAVRPLGPAADDATVPPHGGPGVAGAVEQRGLVLSQVPRPLGPAHGRRV